MGPIVLLSQGTAFLTDVLAELHRRGTPVDAVVLYVAGRAHEAGGPGAWLRGALRAVVRPVVRRLRVRADPRYAGGARRVVFTGPLNGRRMTRHLQRLRPEVVVLARCGLLAPPLLQIPMAGVVNVHPGLLPWIRGNSPIGNSLLRGVPLGATAFRVDAGIDTGRILERRLLPVTDGLCIQDLREALHRLWVEMTADLIAMAGAGELPPGKLQEARFPLCRTLDAPADLTAMDDAARRAVPRALFEEWRIHCGVGFSLPSDADPLRDPHGAA